MNPLEKAARAAYDAHNARTPIKAAWEDQPEHSRDLAREMARAVLMAVREPDLDARITGRNAVVGYQGSPCADYSVAIGAGFTAMIDAILAEEPK